MRIPWLILSVRSFYALPEVNVWPYVYPLSRSYMGRVLRTPRTDKTCGIVMGIAYGLAEEMSQRSVLRRLVHTAIAAGNTDLLGGFFIIKSWNSFDRTFIARTIYEESRMYKDILEVNTSRRRLGYHFLRQSIEFLLQSCPESQLYYFFSALSIPNWKLLMAETKEMLQHVSLDQPLIISAVINRSGKGAPSASGILINRATLEYVVLPFLEANPNTFGDVGRVLSDAFDSFNLPLFNDLRIKGVPDIRNLAWKKLLSHNATASAVQRDMRIVECDRASDEVRQEEEGIKSKADASVGDQSASSDVSRGWTCGCDRWLSYLSPYAKKMVDDGIHQDPTLTSSYNRTFIAALDCLRQRWKSDSIQFPQSEEHDRALQLYFFE